MPFPEHYNDVPAIFSCEQLWSAAKSDKEVADRLWGWIANDGRDQLRPAVINFFGEIVEFVTNRFKALHKELVDNRHHYNVLRKCLDEGKPPNFLQIDSVEIKFLPEEKKAPLQREYRKIMDKASLSMLKSTLKVRIEMLNELCQKAEKLSEEMQKEVAAKWIEAQTEGPRTQTWNRWDHIYDVYEEVQNDRELIRKRIPLSSVLFRTAVQYCRLEVTSKLETERDERTAHWLQKKREKDLRNRALAQLSALPRQEVERSIGQQIEDLVAPVRQAVSNMEQRLNRPAPKAADAIGADSESAKVSRKKKRKSKKAAPLVSLPSAPAANRNESSGNKEIRGGKGRRHKKQKTGAGTNK